MIIATVLLEDTRELLLAISGSWRGLFVTRRANWDRSLLLVRRRRCSTISGSRIRSLHALYIRNRGSTRVPSFRRNLGNGAGDSSTSSTSMLSSAWAVSLSGSGSVEKAGIVSLSLFAELFSDILADDPTPVLEVPSIRFSISFATTFVGEASRSNNIEIGTSIIATRMVARIATTTVSVHEYDGSA